MDAKRKKDEQDLIWWLLNVPDWKKYEDWVLDPKNKEFVDDLKEMCKEKAHIRINLDDLEEESE